MKKIVLFMAGAFLATGLMAQNCTSAIYDTAVTLGFVPNPINGSVEGVPYDEVVTIVLPSAVDNTLTGAPGDSIDLCAISIESITGLPAGYSFEIWATNTSTGVDYDVMATSEDTIGITQASYVTRACLRLTNPNPPAPTMTPPIDSVPVTVVVGAWADILGCQSLASAGGTDTFVVKLPVKGSIFAGVENTNSYGFYVQGNTPNPANGLTYLNFRTPISAEVSIQVVDALGRSVRNLRMTSNAGNNAYPLDVTELEAGIYMYSVTYNGKTISQKMMVSK